MVRVSGDARDPLVHLRRKVDSAVRHIGDPCVTHLVRVGVGVRVRVRVRGVGATHRLLAEAAVLALGVITR